MSWDDIADEFGDSFGHDTGTSGGSLIAKVFNTKWKDLDDEIRQAFETLGFDDTAWNTKTNLPPMMTMMWSDLSPEQQQAALNLKFTIKDWNKQAEQIGQSKNDNGKGSINKAKQAKYREGYNEGFEEGYVAGWHAHYDEAIRDKDKPKTKEEELDELWGACATQIDEDYPGQLRQWFWGNKSDFECINSGGMYYMRLMMKALYCEEFE